MVRPADWSPVDLDRDPTPGDPDEVRELADDLREFSDDVGEALGKIRGLASERAVLDWAGLSADTFRREFEGVPDNLTKLEDSYALCAEALDGYWPKLQTAQGMADRALDRAISAQADLASAQSALSDATDWVGRAGEEAERLQREGERENVEPPDEADVRAATRDHRAAESAATAARGRVNDAQERLSAARQLALEAREMREEAARVCAQSIDEASDAGIQNRKWWQKPIDWVTDNWDTIVDIAKAIVAVLGIVVMIIGGPLAWVVLAAALIVLADTLIKYANGEASLWDVAFAALDCIPGFKGLTTLGGLAKGLKGLATTGLRGLREGALGLGGLLRRGGRQADDLVCQTDPIDMATGEMVMDATDVRLPGVLPLVLRRHHRTSLREGTWFGRSWTSTLDQRLLLDSGGVRLTTEDGMVLSYPRPDAEFDVLPVEGPRWPLAWDGAPGGAIRVTQRQHGLTLRFAPVPGRRGGELPLVEIADRFGNRIRVGYDAEGAPNEVVHDGGYRLGLTTAGRRITAVTLLSDPDQPVLARYGYGEHGDLTEVFDSTGLPLRLTYDDRHRIVGWRDRNDTWYRYTYDESGRCVATEGTDGILASRVAYHTERQQTVFTDSLGNTTVYQFNDCWQPVAETDPAGGTTHRTFDRYDRPLTVTDPLGRTTCYVYDEDGRLTTIVRPDGREVRFHYDEAGLPTSVVEADGSVTRQEFDEHGNRTAVTDAAGKVTRFTYHPGGALAGTVDALGNATTAVCDAAGLPVEVRTPDGGVTRYRRNALGQPVEITDPSGAVNRLEWTPEGRPLHRVDPLGGHHSWRWDPEGNCLEKSDPTGSVVRFEYGPFDIPVAETTAEGVRREFTRDTELRLRQVREPGGATWEYSYDPAGRLVAETDFDGRSRRYQHDAAGQLVARVNPSGETLTLERDVLGQIVTRSAPGVTATFERDPLGRLRRAVQDGTVLEIERDAVGRVTREICDGRSTSVAYDALGRVHSRTTPSGHTSRHTYDGTGHRSAVDINGHLMEFARDRAGRETARTLGPGLSLDQEWDAAGRLRRQSLTVRGAVTHTRGYRYRDDNHLTGIADSRLGDIAYDLDPIGRVTAVTGPGWAERYAYDEAGNQTLADWGERHPETEATGTRSYAGTRLEQAGRIRYTYDAAGRTMLRQRTRLSRKPDTWRYTWDVEDRLTALTTPEGDRWHYRYDALGRRVEKHRRTDDGRIAERVLFSWLGTTLVEQTAVSEADPAPTTLTWDYDGRRPLAQTERRGATGTATLEQTRLDQAEVDERFYAIVTDLVGTPVQLVDETGDIAWTADTTLWGVTRPTAADAPGTPLRFPGQYADAETGWYYNFHRHYDPTTGRYTSPDPLGIGPAPNPVAYPRNPHVWSDPHGLTPCYLFRGTTRDFSGSPNTQNIGITPTSSDPGVATVFATHSESFGEAFVQVIPTRALDDVPYHEGYIRREAEWGVELPADELGRRAELEVPVSVARDILGDMGINIPNNIPIGSIDSTLEFDVPKLSTDQINQFISEARRRV
ncbi:DUF6531 domain-containing protein [Streptomyces sp. NBRC 109706]|uniref:DUF6531 domain-containing protein n=1 Tax=Streptomyces sp. NBRC 109706 TaxID=1550035 RepID=UPI000785FA36|nr:DUF6531 domain-containing protein [Streptomyces sp. NBRC 109706]